LNASELLQVWETGRQLPPLERALLLLTRAGWQDAGSLTIGRQNRALLTLREAFFGPQMACVAYCPRCETQLEFTLNTAELAAPAIAPAGHTISLQHDIYTLTVRQPQLRDLQAAQGQGASLYALCVVDARLGEQQTAIDALPETARQQAAEALLLDDPLLDIQLALDCPACGASWSSPLDLLAFLWQEIEQWGQRMLRGVHRLASAYGWSEGDILALSAWRRGHYLELLNNG
jgi:hypothetical protein